MELGGNAPLIVFDDADLEAAIEGAMVAKMRNAGEACTAANRFYVQAGIYPRFVDALTRRMAALSVGSGIDAATECGPMINARAVARIDSLVQDAVRRGARILCGGSRPDMAGYFYLPTVLTDVSPDAALMHEEIFGPVAAISKFETEDEVIEKANDTEYGLAAYVFTRDIGKGLKVSRRIEAGMVALNRGLMSDPAAPFGGMKQSGLGREGGSHGVLEFTEPQYIAVTL
jgi:succinate-semialdehyde dehydrogenase/glutarate-semialdehyde dehydrogenase